MLTREEIYRNKVMIAGELSEIGNLKALRRICDQAESAIDLQAENERLKKELDDLYFQIAHDDCVR